ncbi:lipocalin-like [Oreochromis aureus]|uniref:lipocalin-like n=1 Tax=Oreochromis aureus TaxID=47969 RepID=UPI0019542F00|nr:lipocalin-like [Oreochromis aureus]
MGILDLSYTSVYNGTCRKMEKVANKTDVPGKFRHISQTCNSENDLRMADVKYDEFALIHSIKTKGKESYVVNKLYGVDLSAEVQENFIQFSLQTSIQPENIVIFPKNGPLISEKTFDVK